MDPILVSNNAAQGQFEVTIGAATAVLQYRLKGDRISLVHTGVPESLAGRGIGAALAKTALEYAKDHQLRVVVICPYVKEYVKNHPVYQPLVVGPV